MSYYVFKNYIGYSKIDSIIVYLQQLYKFSVRLKMYDNSLYELFELKRQIWKCFMFWLLRKKWGLWLLNDPHNLQY